MKPNSIKIKRMSAVKNSIETVSSTQMSSGQSRELTDFSF